MNQTKKAHNLRRLRYGTASTVLTIVVIVAVLLLNILVTGLADRYPLNWDTSADKMFTLSKESIEIAKSVKNKVEIIVFADEEMFSNPTAGAIASVPEDATAMREFYTALQQYRTQSGNKVTFKFINPNQDPTAFAKYEKYEVETYDILFLSGERYKTSDITKLCSNYNDLYMEYANYGAYTFNSYVEKVLGSNINALQSENNKIVQVLVGHEEDEYTIEGLQTLYELNGYTFEELNITGSKAFNKDAEIMLIPAPAKDYSDEEIKRIRDWVSNNQEYGRHLMVFVDYDATCPNLYGMLETDYKIAVTDQLIYETDLNRVQQYTSYYPLCDVPETDYTKNSIGTAKVFTPLARRLTTTLPATAPQDGAIDDIGVVMTNYPESAQVISLKDFTNQNSEGAATLESDDYPLTSMIAAIVGRGTAANGSVVVSGCQIMAYSDYVQNGNLQNEELLLDAINSVTGNEDILTISNKVVGSDTISFDTTTQLWVGIGVFTIGIPVVVLVICLIVFLRRKNL